MSKHPVVIQTWPQRPKTHTEFFFKFQTTSLYPSREGLNSSLALFAGE